MRLPAENSEISPQRQNGFGPFFAHTNVLLHAGRNVNLFFDKIFEKALGETTPGEIDFLLDSLPLKS